MNSKIWIMLSLPEQYIADLKDVNYIFPYYRYDEFVSICGEDASFYASLPLVVRNRDHKEIMGFLDMLSKDKRAIGVFVHNIEGLMLLKEFGYKGKIISGPGLYVWNTEASRVYENDCSGFVYPFELSMHELKEIDSDNGIITVYGKTPLMISANCIRNTCGKCTKGKGDHFGYLTDRKNMNLPVLFQCKNCYNVIYNAVPTSLHQFVYKNMDFTDNFLISFSDEGINDVKSIVSFYIRLLEGRADASEFPLKEYTKAYYAHGVE